MGANLTSGALNIKDYVGFCFFIKWTGLTVSGTWKLQVSNDSGTPTNWTDLSGATYVATGPDSALFIVTSAFYAHVRAVYTRAAGTGTVTEAYFTGKGY